MDIYMQSMNELWEGTRPRNRPSKPFQAPPPPSGIPSPPDSSSSETLPSLSSLPPLASYSAPSTALPRTVPSSRSNSATPLSLLFHTQLLLSPRLPFSLSTYGGSLIGLHSRRQSYAEGTHLTHLNSPPTTGPLSSQYEREESMQLENGLLLVGNHIVTLPELRALYRASDGYFCVSSAERVYASIKALLDPVAPHAPKISALVTMLKRKNDLGSGKMRLMCLVCSKSGKLDVLTVSSGLNNLIQKHDLVIVEGDRGKDMVHVIEPTIGLNFVVILNFLKKREHLRSMNAQRGGQGPDDEHVISLPTKQVLRFASALEAHQMPVKCKSELVAFKTALEKLEQLNAKTSGKKHDDKGPLDLKIFNAEYQFDKKKLIFYYSCTKRNDFRDLIKELFKIYKTRIWLCAVLNPDEFNPFTETCSSSRIKLNGILMDVSKEINNNRIRAFEEEDLFERGSSFSLSSMSFRTGSVSSAASSRRTPLAPVESAYEERKESRYVTSEQNLKDRYQERISKMLLVDESNFKLDELSFDDYQAQNLLNSIENLRIDLGL